MKKFIRHEREATSHIVKITIYQIIISQNNCLKACEYGNKELSLPCQAIKLTKKIRIMTTLNIKGEDLNTGAQVDITLKGSNAFVILPKYLETIKDLHVEDYTLTNEIGEGGNNCMNAGPYLNQRMEELTGMDLRF